MPQGFGYGAVGKAFQAIRGGLGSAAAVSSRYGAKNAFAGGMRSYLGMGAAGIGDALRYGSRMSNIGLSTIGGAAIGGAYGAVSDNTSVLSGALGGAALGGLGYRGMQLGTMGARSAMRAYRGGMGLGASASAGMYTMGRASSRYFRSSYNKAVNGFNAMKGYF